jgi:hypothetical protein
MKNLIYFFNKIKLILLNHFTFAKFLGAFVTAFLVAIIKYSISGNFHLEYCDFWNNLGVALLGWTINTGLIGWLTDYLEIKGLNFNLNQFIYGFDTMKTGPEYPIEYPKPKLYSAMESDGEPSPSNNINKGKGIDKEFHPNYDRNIGIRAGDPSVENKPLDNGKEITKMVLDTTPPVEPFRVTFSKPYLSLDPASIIPKRINPGPGFNVPGGVVPLHDEICKHIEYNSHFLSQFRNMDLETAIEQRNNNLYFVNVLDYKLNYARNALSKVPTIPTTEYEFKLRNQILRDLDSLSKDKVKAQARATLISSRIEYIEGKINKN